MPKTKLQVFCAWCGKCMGAKDGKGTEGISHGICEACLEKEMEKAREAKEGKNGCGSPG